MPATSEIEVNRPRLEAAAIMALTVAPQSYLIRTHVHRAWALGTGVWDTSIRLEVTVQYCALEHYLGTELESNSCELGIQNTGLE